MFLKKNKILSLFLMKGRLINYHIFLRKKNVIFFVNMVNRYLLMGILPGSTRI